MGKDIDYLKEKTNEILEQVKETNGTVRKHSTELSTLKQKVSDHFYFHKYKMSLNRHIDKMSRGQATMLLMAIQIIAMIIIALIVR